MIVYQARDISAFVMYCVNGESGSFLLIESTGSMIISKVSSCLAVYNNYYIFAIYVIQFNLHTNLYVNKQLF